MAQPSRGQHHAGVAAAAEQPRPRLLAERLDPIAVTNRMFRPYQERTKLVRGGPTHVAKARHRCAASSTSKKSRWQTSTRCSSRERGYQV